jgi:hypothetical protein
MWIEHMTSRFYGLMLDFSLALSQLSYPRLSLIISSVIEYMIIRQLSV